MTIIKELMPFISLGITVIGMYFAYQKGLKVDSYKSGENKGALYSDLRYIRERLDELVLEQRHIGEKQEKVQERLIAVEQSAKQAHKRIDELHR